MNNPQQSSKKASMKDSLDQSQQNKQNCQKANIREDSLSSSQSIRNGPFNNLKISFRQEDQQNFQIPNIPIQTTSSQKIVYSKPFKTEQNNPSQNSQGQPQISQQNNNFKQNQNQQQFFQQQPQVNKVIQQQNNQKQQQQIVDLSSESQFRQNENSQFFNQQPQQHSLQNNLNIQQQYYQQYSQNKQPSLQQFNIQSQYQNQYQQQNQHQNQHYHQNFNQVQMLQQQQQQYYQQFQGYDNQYQQDLNQQHTQNKAQIDLLEDEASKNQQNELNSVINSLSGQEDIQIKIQNPKQQLSSQLLNLNKQYEQQLEFQQFRQNNASSNVNNQMNKSSIVQNDNKIIIQINPQEENSLQKEMKALIFEWKCMRLLSEEAENYYFDIDLDVENYQYKLTSNYQGLQQNRIKKFYTQFEQKLQNFIILTHSCKYQEEAIQKHQILQKPQFKKILVNEFKIQPQFIDIDLMSNIAINQIPKCLKDVLRFYLKQNIVIVSLIDYDVEFYDLSVFQLQEKLNIIINNLIVQHQDENQIIHVDNQIDLDSIKFQILQINTDNTNIQISNPNYDHIKNKHYYQIIYNTWMLKQDQNEEISESLQELKHKIENIINPFMELRVDNQEQIKIWDKLIQFQYNYKQVKVVKANNYIQIKFVSEKEENIKNKKEIFNNLQSLQYSQFVFQLDQSIISILKEYQIWKLFQKELQDLKDKQKIEYLQTFEIEKQQIKFESIYKDHKNAFINLQLQEYIINKIKIENVDQNFNEIFQYQQKSKEQYEQNYNCYIQLNNKQTSYVTLEENVLNIQQSIKEYKDSFNIKSAIIQRQIENKLLLENIKQNIKNDNSYDKKLNIIFNEDDNSIEFRGPENIVNESLKKLDSLIQNEIQKLKTIKIQINSRIWKYLNDRQKNELKNIEKQFRCIVTTKEDLETFNQGQNYAKLQFNNKTLLLRQGDIIKQNCDAIVNSCNQQMNFGNMSLLTGVAAKILEFGGPTFRNHSEALINKLGKLQDADLYKVPNSTTIKNIISVPTIHYSTADTNIDQFTKHIQSIFRIANQYYLKSLVIPILGGGSAGYFFKTVSHIILNEVLVQMESSKYIENVVIIENQQVKIGILVNQLQTLVNPPNIRQIKYQFQWFDDDCWKDYDDVEINQQIDEGYEQFLNNNNNNQIEIKFPFTKQPGTHYVDLKRMIVTDINTGKTQKISLINETRTQQYSIDGQPVNQALSEFIELQKLSNQFEFQIFLNNYKIVFKRKKKIKQINQETSYKRKVRFSNYQKQQIQSNKLPIKSQLLFEEYSMNQFLQNTQSDVELVVKSYDQGSLNIGKQAINDLIEKNTATLQWKVLNLNDQQRTEVEQYITDKSIYFKGQINDGENLEIYCLKTKIKKLNDYFEALKMKQIYPQNWSSQNTNMIKVELSTSDDEYIKVSELFKISYQKGRIYQINRIQNKVLYEDFIAEKQKLQNFRQSKGQQLTQTELERYVWHGVSGQHPKVIYSGQQNFF